MKILLQKAFSSMIDGVAVLKWLLILAFVSLAVVAGFFYLSDQKAREQVVQLSAANDELQKQVSEFEKHQAENQAKPSEDNNLELVKLRGEVAKYRGMEKQVQALQTEAQQLRAKVQELQQVHSETALLRNQNVQLQGFLQDKGFTDQCQNNLRAITGAKAQWALENRKGAADMPTDIDLFGKYLPQKPVCPKGGVYTLGVVQIKPTCTIPGHNY